MVSSNWTYAVSPDDIAELGASLRQVKQQLKPGRVWYYGGETYFDVLFDVQDGDIQWFQFTLRGRSLTWDRKGNLIRTGNTNELDATQALEYPASKLIQDDSQADTDFIALVQSILATRPQEAIFQQVLNLLSQSHGGDRPPVDGQLDG
ncbi:MAG: hypothetical protein IGR80_14470 [Synechococcales cyanobacterium K44_A2020_017]|uniref:hypothetical protein n=1 Tax=Leptolyngbya sp. CCY15150 TaxID=2767772 RepID=UPI00194F00E9|nr:hypothetical protein [Leptolyngbya sp. CCY15150]MBF2089674.1 hypothetical protein [Synechococcales cyanobacterium K32_A2020_035]MBF2095948.1 hypothetical protein [Synechococcales cyanobacterium K44_A2020_017]